MPTCFITVTGPSSPFAPQVQRTDFANCEWIVMNGSDYVAMQQAVQFFATCQSVGQCASSGSSVLDTFSAADGAMLSASVIACWVTAFGIRSVIDVIRGSTNEIG